MEQLKMNWINDKAEVYMPVFPQGLTLKNFVELDNSLDIWLDIVQYGLSDKKEGADYYKTCMTDLPNYKDDFCFFILKDGVPAATITVVCDYQNKHGLIHMVACKPEFRGLGIGTLLNKVALYYLKKEGMMTASLKTDDWRIPAIKGYLRIGFTPDVTTEPDYKERWDKIINEIK
jgi:mycothiol synthase